VEVVDKEGNSLLHLAALTNTPNLIEVIIEKYPEAVKLANKEWNLPVHLTAMRDHLHMTKALLKIYP